MLKAIKEIEAYNQALQDQLQYNDLWFDSLGMMIRIEREKKGLSLREMARRMNISAAFLSDVELGRRGISDDFLLKLKKLKI